MFHILEIFMTTMPSLAPMLFHLHPRRRATTLLTHPETQNLLNPCDNSPTPLLSFPVPHEPLGRLPIVLDVDINHRDQSIPATHRKWKCILHVFVKAFNASLPAIQMALAAVLQTNGVLYIILIALLQVGVSLTQTDTDTIPQSLTNLQLPNHIPLINVDTRHNHVHFLTLAYPASYPKLNHIIILRSVLGMPLRVERYDVESGRHYLVLWDPWYYWSARSPNGYQWHRGRTWASSGPDHVEVVEPRAAG